VPPAAGVTVIAGRLWTGTSGFAYPAWSPRFYPAGLRSADLLRHYASRLGTVELNNTFYRTPSAAAIDGWLGATPDDFRFAVKAQKGGSWRAIRMDPSESVPWLTTPLRAFGERLGTVLFRVPEGVPRNDERLAAMLAVWPRELPLAMEFQDASWHVDETFAALREVGAAIVTTDLPEDPEPPTIRRTGSLLYLRLRRADYPPDELRRWLARLEPFLGDGVDALVYFRHDDVGRGAELALELADLATEVGLTAGPSS
jgi:uncharacterized protein YecE (DUF72 family)